MRAAGLKALVAWFRMQGDVEIFAVEERILGILFTRARDIVQRAALQSGSFKLKRRY